MIRLSVPFIDDNEMNEIKNVLNSGYLVQGNKVEEFENLIKEYLNVKHAIAVSNGTAALYLSLIALDIKPSDEIIVPDFTFPATSNVVENMGAKSIFVDINLDDFCIDTDKIENKINNNTKVIIPVHEFGQVSNMDKIMDLASKYSLRVVEDAACALGAEYKNRKIGTIGDLGCFSFHPRKSITTGEGGIVVTNNDEYARKIRAIRNHGIDYYKEKPKFIYAGLNYRMTNIQGAIGVAQFRKLDEISKARKIIANKYNEKLYNVKGIILPREKEYSKHIWQTYHILLNKNINRDSLIKNLKEKGIETNFGAYAVHEQDYYKNKYNYDDKEFKKSSFAWKQGLALPLYVGIKDNEIDYIVSQLKDHICN
ncbi:DegT/DnrJ/EryC1/StrS family aminotransferase [Clostridium botulinum]|uniref:DegT/DnrJ/EryC1/StrS family aminotransferase n=1 Tax=Clostridium botulinum TaxID=1491 RepID=UPI001748F0C2|nr:DegT/DnrJ/EryC1/StrS family aminotransferase [Clostridium botulinum]MBD5637190.1 DegT/DnrJ/EryC1/StrS family aminotransferase [Clostridium botulinum]